VVGQVNEKLPNGNKASAILHLSSAPPPRRLPGRLTREAEQNVHNGLSPPFPRNNLPNFANFALVVFQVLATLVIARHCRRHRIDVTQ
jgi:hypothetical protein